MINENTEIPVSEGKTFDALPEDIYQVVIEDVELKDVAKFEKPNETEKVFNFTFSVMGGEFEGRKLWKKIRPVLSSGSSNNKPSLLFVLLKAVLKRDPRTDVKLTAKDINKLVGKQLRVVVKNTTKGDRTYNNIDSMISSKEDVVATKKEEVKEEPEIPIIGGEDEIDYDEKETIDPKDIPF